MTLFPHEQIDDYSRAGEALTVGRRAVNCSHRPAHVGQACNGRHDLQARRCLTHVSPCITHRGLHCAPVFSIHVARALLSVEPRQRVGAFPPPRTRLAATLHSRRFISSRLQFRRIGNKLGRYQTDPCEHLERLSSVRGSDTWNHSEVRNGRVPNSKANLPKSRGELPNVA